MEGGVKGLIVLVSALMIQVLAFGNYACVGIYTVHLLNEFRDDAVGVSLISSVHFAVLLGCGPLASFLLTKASYRKISLVGAALVVVGILCMPLIVSIPAMCVFFGCFAGLGGCLIYLPSHLLSGLYYDKHRSLAMGVATAGTALGATIMPLVVGVLIDEYTWKGSLMILAGLDMHLFIFALFMVPPPASVGRLRTQSRVSLLHELDAGAVERTADTKPLTLELPERESTGEHDQNDNIEVGYSEANAGNGTAGVKEDKEILKNSKENEHDLSQSWEKDDTILLSSSLRSNGSESRFLNPKRVVLITTACVPGEREPANSHWDPRTTHTDYSNGSATEDRDDHEALLELRDNQNTNSPSVEIESAFDVEFDQKRKKSGKGSTWKYQFRNHIALFTDFHFVIYFLSTMVWNMTTTLFVTFGPELIVVKGYSARDAAFVFTFFGIGQLVGCIFNSVLGNFVGKRVILYICSNLLTGVSLGLTPLVQTFAELAAALMVTGLAYGGILGLYMSVMVDLVGVKNMEVGLGYVLLAAGIGCFGGPPLGGAMSKVFGNYDLAFYMAGIVTLVGALLMSLVYVPTCKPRKKKDKM